VVGGEDLRWISGYISLKDPDSPPQWWHQDWWCWDHPISHDPGAAQVALLCHLSATDEDRAALRVLPGSHREPTDLHAALREPHAEVADDLDGSHPATSDQPEQVTLRMAAGDAVVLDYRLLQGTHPNRGAARRDCVLLTFAPAWRRLPPEIRGHLISHPALPGDDEAAAVHRPWAPHLLPSYDGPRRDLPLNRSAFTKETAAER
jgi:ectoine hydroxylase-related dioxygenase (phytanoyl-CoA dioxygenase family)